MKIVQVCNYTPPARDAMGAERIVERIAQGLVRSGHDVSLKVLGGICPVKGARLTETLDDADIVHFHGWDLEAYSKCNKPWVTTIHGYELHQKASEAYRLRNVIAVSQFAARNIGAMHYVWNCADPDEFKYEPKKDNYFLWISGTDWGESKGLFTTIDLAKRMKFNLKIAGTGNNARAIDRIKSECGGTVEYLGAVNGEDKVRLIQKAKALFLLTRLPDACPVVVSEALMCGTPVICSRSGAMPEIVLHNITGIHATSMAECIRAVSTVEKVSPRTCRGYAEQFFSIDVCAKNYITVYNRALEHHARKPQKSIIAP